MAAVAMMAVGCQKDRNADGMLLLAEGFNNNGSKVLVDGLASTWADGDEVRINDQTAAVSVTTGNASVHLGSGVDAPFYGVYPAGIYGSNSGASYTLNLPATYTYETDGTHQKLASPMVGYTDNSTSMTFKHLTAAVTVQIKNDFGIDVTVTNVTVSSNKYKLNGTTAVTLGNSIAVAAEETDNAALRQVQMNFTGTALNITSGNSANVQVPVLPVGDDNRFTISVTVQNKDDAEMVYTFNKTQGSTQGTYALGRAELGYAPAKFGSTFVVNSSGDEIRFSPGNLQYIGSAITPYWKFATHQYDYIGSGQGVDALNVDRDLFGWGTSGYDNTTLDAFAVNYLPYSTTESPATYSSDPASAYQTNRYGYGPSTSMTDNSLVGTSANYDWGCYNAISNGGNVANRWRTLTKDEFSYILNSRTTSYKIGYTPTRYIYACLLGVYHGIIILPSDYVHPDGIAAPVYGTSGWSSNAYNAEEWAKIESTGAVFLPAAGQRKGTTYSNGDTYGNYWTTTYGNVTNANYYYFTESNVKTTTTMKYYGYSVRLVRDVE